MDKRLVKNEDKSFTDTKTNLTWNDELGRMTPKYMKQMIEIMNEKTKTKKKKWRIPTVKELIKLFKVYDHENKDFWIAEKTKHSTYANVYSVKNKIYMKEILLSSHVILVRG